MQKCVEKLRSQVYSHEMSRSVQRAPFTFEGEKKDSFVIDPIFFILILGFAAACITAVVIDRLRKNRSTTGSARKLRTDSSGDAQRNSSGTSSQTGQGYLTQRNVKPGALTV